MFSGRKNESSMVVLDEARWVEAGTVSDEDVVAAGLAASCGSSAAEGAEEHDVAICLAGGCIGRRMTGQRRRRQG